MLDTSGSMEGEKIEQAREALLYVLEHLNPDDRFNIVEFSTGAREYARELVAPSEAEDAARWVERLGATGGTDINLALLTALDMVEPGRPTMILFLTDGLPTEGEIDTSRIIANVADAAPENVRLFAFGVGDDVDAILLDTLSSEHHGRTTYVRPGEALNESVSSFYSGITAPCSGRRRGRGRGRRRGRDLPRPATGPLRRFPAHRPRHLPGWRSGDADAAR